MNRKTLKHALLGAAMVFASLSATESFAQANTSNLTVQATVPSICVIDAGTTDATMTIDLSTLGSTPPTFDSTSVVGWRCSNGTNMNIQINGGTSIDVENRVLTGPGPGFPTMAYSLHTSLGGPIWGDNSGASTVVPVAGVGMGTVNTETVFGRINLADAQNATPGLYSDTVIISFLP